LNGLGLNWLAHWPNSSVNALNDELSRYLAAGDDTVVHRFFERTIPYTSRPKSLMQYNDWYWDNYKFIIHEMFLYTVAILLKHERFDLVLSLMTQGYYVGDALDNPREPMQHFGIIQQHMESLLYRSKRLQLNRISLRADMLEQRSHASGVEVFGVMQADFVLFFFVQTLWFSEYTHTFAKLGLRPHNLLRGRDQFRKACY